MFNGPCLFLCVCVAFSDWTGDSLTMVSGCVCTLICLCLSICVSVDFFFLSSLFAFFLLPSLPSFFIVPHFFPCHVSFSFLPSNVSSFTVLSIFYFPFLHSYLSFFFLFFFFRLCLKLLQCHWSVGFVLHKSSLSLVTTFSFIFFHKALQCLFMFVSNPPLQERHCISRYIIDVSVKL